MSVCVYVRVRVCVCVRACVRACVRVRACVSARARVCVTQHWLKHKHFEITMEKEKNNHHNKHMISDWLNLFNAVLWFSIG